jgi:hypothetical protein
MENGAAFLREEMTKWWGPKVSKPARDSMLAHDILLNAVRVDLLKPTARWFIGKKEVCRNFYLRARGTHHELARRIEKKVLEKRFAIAAVVKDRVLKKEKGNTTELIIKDWLRNYASQFNERSSMEEVTVLPYRNVKPVYHQYKADFLIDDALKNKKKLLSPSQFGSCSTDIQTN